MSRCLVFNPGSASLKFDLIELDGGQRHAAEATKLVSASIEEIGDHAELLVFRGRDLDHKEHCEVQSIADGERCAVR